MKKRNSAKYQYNPTQKLMMVATMFVIAGGVLIILAELFTGSGVFESNASDIGSKPSQPKNTGNVVTRAASNVSSAVSKVVNNAARNVSTGICRATGGRC